jgi:multidrug resistance efflux pump
MVEKGELLAKIDATDAELTRAAAIAEYAASKRQAENDVSIRAAVKAAEVAEKEYEMGMEANRIVAKALPESDIQRRKLTVDRSELQAELAQHEQEVAVLQAEAKYKQYELAEAKLQRRSVKSYMNGMVVELVKHAGDWVTPGDTIMHIIQMDQLRVQGFVPANRFSRNELLGKTVDVEVSLTGGGIERVQGRITFASPLVEAGSYKVWAEVNNRQSADGQWLLNPGLRAAMTIRGLPATQ